LVDDGWIDDEIIEDYTEEAVEAALKHDGKDLLYKRNINPDGIGPLYFEPSPEDHSDALFLFQRELENGEAVEVEDQNFEDGTIVSGYILQKPADSRGDIQASGIWREGAWNLEFKRKLKTGHSDDVQFDTAKTYRFGIAIMDNTGGFEKYGTGHSFLLGARTLEFGGGGSEVVAELSLIRDYLVSSKAYANRGDSGLALSTISDALTIFNRIRDPVADADPDLFIKIRNGFVDSRRNPSLENINRLIDNTDLTILTIQGKRKPTQAGLALKILVVWGRIQVYAFIALSMLIMPIFLEGTGRLGALFDIPILQNFSFTTSEYVTLTWAMAMFVALYIGRIGFNEIDSTLKSLEYYSKELEQKMIELKESQEQLLKSERLASIGQLAASMAHEIRNPLGVIKNVSYYLKMNLPDTDEKVKKHLKILDGELATSNKIITDLLNFSSGKLPTLAKTDLSSVIENSVSRARIPENIEVKIRLSKKIHGLRADKEQLQRVFLNLITNAVQAMPDGGLLKINSLLEDESAVVHISDTGGGIPKEDQSKIFEPLYTTKAKGIGLGLALTKQIVEMHDGAIQVESEVGKGTKFIVKLPIHKNDAKKVESSDS
jgi:signal transduction histidine kinase